MTGSFLTQFPLRASADIATCRVVSLSGNHTAAQAADETVEPIGISEEWSFLPPIPSYGLSTLHARGASADPVSFKGRGQVGHAVVGTGGIAAAGRVMADGDASGRVIAAVPPCWSVGFVADDDAPEDSKIPLYVDPIYLPVVV